MGEVMPFQSEQGGAEKALHEAERHVDELLHIRSAIADGVWRGLNEIDEVLANLQESLAVTRERFAEIGDVVEKCRADVIWTRRAAGFPPATLNGDEEKLWLLAARPQKLRELLGVKDRRKAGRRSRSA